jgi:hypothetical protein
MLMGESTKFGNERTYPNIIQKRKWKLINSVIHNDQSQRNRLLDFRIYVVVSIIFRLALSSGQKLILGQLATITPKVVPFHTYAPFPSLLSFLNASWKSYSVRVF